MDLSNNFTAEDKLLTRHIIDLANQHMRSSSPKFSYFLDERQQALAVSALNHERIYDYILYGGYDNAIRKTVLFGDFKNNFPFVPLVYNFRECDSVTHRDVLGSLMAQNIKREAIGDILITSKRAVVFAMRTVLPICEEITKIGRIGVTVSHDFCEGDISVQQFEEIKATVNSPRLDSIVSSALRMSREKTQELILKKGVTLNHFLTFKPDERVSENDTFSISGFGKFVLREVGGLSKKDRIFITINKFI